MHTAPRPPGESGRELADIDITAALGVAFRRRLKDPPLHERFELLDVSIWGSGGRVWAKVFFRIPNEQGGRQASTVHQVQFTIGRKARRMLVNALTALDE